MGLGLPHPPSSRRGAGGRAPSRPRGAAARRCPAAEAPRGAGLRESDPSDPARGRRAQAGLFDSEPGRSASEAGPSGEPGEETQETQRQELRPAEAAGPFETVMQEQEIEDV